MAKAGVRLAPEETGNLREFVAQHVMINAIGKFGGRAESSITFVKIAQAGHIFIVFDKCSVKSSARA